MTLIQLKTSSRWLAPHRQRPSARLRLFCLPFAGGSASAYRDWSTALPRDVEVCPVELPGRGTRYSEPAVASLHELIPALTDALEGWFDRPFVFYGHSMGALLAFELAHELRARTWLEPAALFVGARPGPSESDQIAVADMTDAEVIAYIRSMSDHPELLDHPELMKLLLPTLRRDLALCGTYSYRPRRKLACSMTVFGGIEDHISRTQLESWRAETENAVDVEMLPGGHFFLRTSRDALLRSLSARLDALEYLTVRKKTESKTSCYDQ
jgi:medium-chain acyl-[acyl-carrier-protein] hydrolase